MYARKLDAELIIGTERWPAPLDWLDSFCMRNFTGSAEFDDTLPPAKGGSKQGSRGSGQARCGHERVVH